MEREIERGIFAPRSRRFIVPAGEKVFYARKEFRDLPNVLVTNRFDQVYLTKREEPEKLHELFGRELAVDISAADLEHKLGAFGASSLRDLASVLYAQARRGQDVLSSNPEHANVFFIPDESGKIGLSCIRCLASGQWRLYANPVTSMTIINASSWVFTPLAP